jgi:hypothetical protein
VPAARTNCCSATRFHFGDWLALDTGIDGTVFGATDVLLIGKRFLRLVDAPAGPDC